MADPEDNLSEDWQVLRSKLEDKIPLTLNAAEAFSRLYKGIFRVLNEEQSPSRDRMFLSLHGGLDESGSFLFRIGICGLETPDTKLLKVSVSAPNKEKYWEDVETALEQAYALVVEDLGNYNSVIQEDLDSRQSKLDVEKDRLMTLRKILKEMGEFSKDHPQMPLPFTEGV